MLLLLLLLLNDEEWSNLQTPRTRLQSSRRSKGQAALLNLLKKSP